ncbi:MAG: TonB-dependent receptor [Muribaculaceae bacterium]|nr:TonB-dependent receptor [Muribaculaceae bacterium]
MAPTSLIFATVALTTSTDAVPDSLSAYNLEELNVVAVKQEALLREDAVSATVIGRSEIEELSIEGMKAASNVIPNFYIPDYGSRITSSIYVRGIGARMDQPAVGLNVDNIPYLNKDAYDFDIADIASIEMLRGPQSTLYGRNTMGGLINITTLSPMSYQGWRLMLQAGSGNSYKAAAGWYGKINDCLATSVNVNGAYLGGFFTNLYTGKKLDHEASGAFRWKTQWRASGDVSLMNAFSSSLLRQGGYPYQYIETGEISYNDPCFYHRFTVNDGLTLNYRGPGFSMTSITTVQHINDNMTLDQDFLPLPYFTLTQKQQETALTEDVVFRGSLADGAYKWLGGVFGFYKHLAMQAPVTFKDEGIRTLIEAHRNEANPYYPIEWDSREFPLLSDFTIPTRGIALYHESKYETGHWHFTGGIRLDYEIATLKYLSRCDTGYEIMHLEEDGSLVPYNRIDIKINDEGKLSRKYFNWMPRVSVLYDFSESVGGNVYGVVSKGYKAGGFNTQMFSEVLQGRLMGIMGIGGNHEVDEIVGYKPEYSWNYEVGSHLELFNGHLWADLSLFYIDCRDQQMTTFPDGTTTGRIMTNAGRTRSTGGEIAVTGKPCDELTLNASYGYTNAKFVDYDDGKTQYKGKYIPYAPRNTIFAQGLWEIPIRKEWPGGIRKIGIDLNMRGTGKIYWNESNTRCQPFYAELGATLTFEARNWELQIWGENLTDTRFDTFYFMSMGNEFLQRGKPVRGGATLRFTF